MIISILLPRIIFVDCFTMKLVGGDFANSHFLILQEVLYSYVIPTHNYIIKSKIFMIIYWVLRKFRAIKILLLIKFLK